LLVVVRRLRYELSRRDWAAMFLARGFEFNREAVRDWEVHLRGFGSFEAASRFCRAYNEQRNYFRRRFGALQERMMAA
jgi:hypothetical protein